MNDFPKTIPDGMAYAAERYGDRVAIYYDGLALTWNGLNQQADSFAKLFCSFGIHCGAHVAILSANKPMDIIVFYALQKIGAVTVFLNSRSNANEIEFMLEHTECEVLICEKGFKSDEFLLMARHFSEKKKRDPRCLNNLKQILFAEDPGTDLFLSLDKAMERFNQDGSADICAARGSVRPEDTGMILFTSGTTSKPKAVMLSQQSLMRNALEGVKAMRITAEERYCVAVPLFHCFCIITNVLSALHSGGALAFGKSLQAKDLLACIERFRCNILNSVPTTLLRMASETESAEYDLSSLRTGIIGGNRYSLKQYEEIVEKLGYKRLMTSLGMTEATATVTFVGYDDPYDLIAKTVGRFIPGTEGKIVDIHTGETVPANVVGEICIRGCNVMQGYYHQQDMTEKTVVDGWLHTGDLGEVDENGYLTIRGRLKNIIIRGGENISPVEIEECLMSRPDVRNAVAVGIPDHYYGEKVCACIILSDGRKGDSEEFKRYCRDHLAKYKVPEYYLFYDDFPVTASGKIRREELKRSALGKLQKAD